MLQKEKYSDPPQYWKPLIKILLGFIFRFLFYFQKEKKEETTFKQYIFNNKYWLIMVFQIQ